MPHAPALAGQRAALLGTQSQLQAQRPYVGRLRAGHRILCYTDSIGLNLWVMPACGKSFKSCRRGGSSETPPPVFPGGSLQGPLLSQ